VGGIRPPPFAVHKSNPNWVGSAPAPPHRIERHPHHRRPAVASPLHAASLPVAWWLPSRSAPLRVKTGRSRSSHPFWPPRHHFTLLSVFFCPRETRGPGGHDRRQTAILLENSPDLPSRRRNHTNLAEAPPLCGSCDRPPRMGRRPTERFIDPTTHRKFRRPVLPCGQGRPARAVVPNSFLSTARHTSPLESVARSDDSSEPRPRNRGLLARDSEHAVRVRAWPNAVRAMVTNYLLRAQGAVFGIV